MSVKSIEQIGVNSSLINFKNKNSSSSLTVKNNNSAIIEKSGKQNSFDRGFSNTRIIIDDSPPENRLIKSKNLCVLRPESLINLDFKSVNISLEGEQLITSNSETFVSRLAKRKIDLESCNLGISSAAESSPNEFEKAVNQYRSSLAAASSEIALLKIAHDFKFYAEIGSSFSSFINFYLFDYLDYFDNQIPETQKGFSFKNYMKYTMQWGSNDTFLKILEGTISNEKDATLFLQFINDLSFSCAFSTPVYAMLGNRFGLNNSANLQNIKSKISYPNTKILNIFSNNEKISLQKNKVNLTRFSRDLTASLQLGKIIKAKGDENEKLKQAIEKYSNDFFDISKPSKSSLFKYVFGWDPYASSYSDISLNNYDKEDYYYVPDFSSYRSGLVSKIFTIDEKAIIISTNKDEYQSKEKIKNKRIDNKSFSGTESLVDKSFLSNSGIDLRIYIDAISQLQDNLEDAAYIFKQSFRILDKIGSKKSKEPLASNSHHTSTQNFYAKSLKIVNNRYLKKFTKYLGFNASELLDSPESSSVNSEEFYKCWAIHFILNYPNQSKKIIQNFIEDYNKGFLTFSENSKIEKKNVLFDSQNVEIEQEIRDNVFPGTKTPNDLEGKRSSLYQYLQNLESEIRSIEKTNIDVSSGDGKDYQIYSSKQRKEFLLIQPASPTNIFCGSLETSKSLSDLQSSGFFELKKGDLANLAYINQVAAEIDQRAELLFEWQQCNCMWVKEGNTVYPAGIIPVAGGIIDAVMTVLFEVLSEVLEIKPADKSSTFFPSIESYSPPYHKQIFDTATSANSNIKYIGGLGSFSTLNSQYWIPVLNAFNSFLTRENQDKSMIFSGASMMESISSVIDCIRLIGKRNNLGIAFNSAEFKSQFIAERSINQIDKPQIPKFGNKVSAGSGTILNNFIEADTILGLEKNAFGSNQIKQKNYNPYSQAIIGDPGSFGLNNSPLNLTIGQSTDFKYSTASGTYLFATVKNMKSESYKKLLGYSEESSMNSSATPSQLLDRLFSETAKDAIKGFIDRVEGEIKTFSEQGYSLNLTARNFIPLETISGVFNEALIKVIEQTTYLDDVNNPIYSVSNKIKSLNDNYQNNNLSFGQAIDYVNDLWSDILGLINKNETKSQIPDEIWLLKNLSGNQNGSPFESLLNSSFNEIESISEATYAGSQMTKLGDEWWLNDAYYGNNKLSALYQYISNLFVEARDEDIRLGIAFDMIDKFAERIKKYSETAYDGLVGDPNKPSALEKFISDLSKTVPGKDVLQNLTRYQLSLKAAALQRSTADENNAFIPKSEVITPKKEKAINLMLNTEKLSGKEGKNIRGNVIGFPAGFFKNIYNKNAKYTGPLLTDLSSISTVKGETSPLYGLRVNCKLPDYPVLSVIPKIFRFDYELFVLEDAFDSVDFDKINTWEDLVRNTTFTRIRFVTEEGKPGTAKEIVRIDAQQKEIVKDLEKLTLTNSSLKNYNSTLFDIYSNTLASYLVEQYYKVFLGLGFNEDSFSSIQSGLNIPINDYSIDLSKALASIYKDLNQDLDASKLDEVFISKKDITSLEFDTLTPNLKKSNNSIVAYENVVKNFEKEIKDGEFKDVDASLFESFSNASSSLLFSAKTMRDKIISAKYFDRIVYVLIDPDEFLLANSDYYIDQIENNKISLGDISNVNLNNLKDAYSSYEKKLLQKKLISVNSNNPKTYKINPRLDEGNVSFSSTYFSVIRNQESNSPYDVTLNENTPGDLIIVNSIKE